MNLGCATLGPRFGPAFHPKSVTNTLRDTKPRQSGANDWDVEPIYSECIATLGERRPTCAWSGRACAHRSSAISFGRRSTMKVRAPVWRLRTSCPVCLQGECLLFLACGSCGHVVLICEEEGSAFLDPRNVASTTA